jgi:hypothetical protein
MDPDHCETCGAKLTTRQALRSSSSARVSRHLTDKRQCYACRQKELERRKRYCETCGVKLTTHNRSLNYKGRCHACGRKEFERRKEEIAQGSKGTVESVIVSPDTPSPPPSPTTWQLPSTPPSEPRRAHSDLWQLVDQCFEVFRKKLRESNWQINEVIDHYIIGVQETGVIELRAIVIVALVDYLTGRYAQRHDKIFLLDNHVFNDPEKKKKLQNSIKCRLLCLFTSDDVVKRKEQDSFKRVVDLMAGKSQGLNRYSFGTLLTELSRSLNLRTEKEEKKVLTRFVDIRNLLVHEARFLRPGEVASEYGRKWTNVESSVSQYFRVMDIAGCLLLAMLQYNGRYHNRQSDGWLMMPYN